MSEEPLDRLDPEIEPPPALENRVTNDLVRRGLIAPAQRQSMPWLARRPLLALAAASLALVVGFSLGRATSGRPASSIPAADRYALLLYETDGYRPASGTQEIERYREYSRWVAEARRREQFLTGEDLDVARGWVLAPDEDRALATPGVAASSAAPLSGVFLITASDEREALELAETLPHLAHGGEVVIQKVVPTETPPEPGASEGLSE